MHASGYMYLHVDCTGIVKLDGMALFTGKWAGWGISGNL